MALKLSFYGGAGKVTGSNFLVSGEKGRILVDCGIEQGIDFCEECVYGAFPYNVKNIDALIVTHAHLDHVGRIPKLVKEGFRKKIFMTPPTRDLMALILHDSIGILGEDAKRRGTVPLYEKQDVDAPLSLVETLAYRTEKEVAPGLSLHFTLSCRLKKRVSPLFVDCRHFNGKRGVQENWYLLKLSCRKEV